MREHTGRPILTPHTVRPLLTAIAMAVVAMNYPAATAVAEAPIEALLVVPDGAELVTGPDGPVVAHAGDFLDGIEGLDVHRQTGALGFARRDGQRLMITAVRLASAEEAAQALQAFGANTDPSVEVLPEIAPDTIAHRVIDDAMGSTFTVVEVSRATGRDLVVYAQVDGSREVSDFAREAIARHMAAFPDVTPPAGASGGSVPWLVVAGGAAALLAVTLLVLRRRRNAKPTPAPPTPIDPSRIRVNW